MFLRCCINFKRFICSIPL